MRYKTVVPAARRASSDPAERRRARARLFGTAALLVTFAGVLVALVSVLEGTDNPHLKPGAPVPGAALALAPLAGVAQHGIELGDPRAPLTLVEFCDLQSKDCAKFARGQFPRIVRRYVRTGKLLVVYRALDLLGPDSLRAASMALALAQQRRLFQFASLMYEHQGEEDTEYVSEDYLRALSEAIPGAAVTRALRARSSAAVRAQLGAAQRLGARLGVASVPTFLLYRSDHVPARLRSATLDAGSLRSSLRRLLGVP